MFCQKCGKEIPEESLFCLNCGVPTVPLAKQEQSILPAQQWEKWQPWQPWVPPEQKRIAENKAQGIACCPKCGSASLSANKKGFGVGKTVVGAAVTGGIGLVAGNIGARKVWVTCLNCGNRWKR